MTVFTLLIGSKQPELNTIYVISCYDKHIKVTFTGVKVLDINKRKYEVDVLIDLNQHVYTGVLTNTGNFDGRLFELDFPYSIKTV
jgi:hypothetical protein